MNPAKYLNMQKKVASALLKLKSNVRPDWIDPKDMDSKVLARLMEAAIASKDWRLMVAIYAAAILIDHRQKTHPDEAFPWADVAVKVQKRFWYVPNIVSILKRDAWAHILKAKTRQTTQGVAFRPSHSLLPGRDLARFWRVLGWFAAYGATIALVFIGGLFVVRLGWGLAFWTFHAEQSQMEVWIRMLDLRKWGI